MIYRFSIIFTTIFLVALGTVTAIPAGAQHLNGGDVRAETSSPKTEMAYMDLALTTRDEAGGQITVDDAISLYFRSDATDGWDPYDASKMLPRGDTWAIMGFIGKKGGEETLKAQESRPYEDSVQVLDVKLVQKNMPAATYTLSVDRWYSVPENWSLRLRSQTLDTTFVIDEKSDTATFSLGPSSKSGTTASSPPSGKATSDTTHIPMAGAVGPRSSTLPVELAAFSASLDQERALLQWATASETNNSGFVVQHRRKTASESQSPWSRLGFVEGQGTTSQSHEYQFTTASLRPGTHFFRLKQIDHDGTTHYTEVLRVTRRPTQALDLRTGPNPFSSRLTVSFTARSTQTVRIRLVDMLGRVVHRTGSIKARSNAQVQKQIDARRLSSGSYVLQVKGQTFSTSRRVVHVD